MMTMDKGWLNGLLVVALVLAMGLGHYAHGIPYLLDPYTLSSGNSTSCINGTLNSSYPYPYIVNETLLDGYAVVWCETGYEMAGEAEAVLGVCNQSTGAWTFEQEPVCVAISCQSPPIPAYGEFSNATVYGSEGNYSCNPGFSLVGSNATTCQADGSWSDPEPTCRESCSSASESSMSRDFSDDLCFDFSSETLSWEDAKIRCSDFNGSLAVITTNATLTFLQESIADIDGATPPTDGGFWIGAYEEPKNYSWIWHTGRDNVNEFFWDLNEPTNRENEDRIILSGLTESEVSQRHSYGWADYQSDRNDVNGIKFGFICQFASTCNTAGISPNGNGNGVGYDYNGLCYFIATNGQFTWDEANTNGNAGIPGCSNSGNNQGFLAEIRDQTTQSSLVNKLEEIDSRRNYWIGAERSDGDGDRSWLWVDGSGVPATWWGPEEPSKESEQCVNLFFLEPPGKYLMNDATCTNSYRFICQFSLGNFSSICGDPGTPYHGSRVASPTPFEPDDAIQYTCNLGYQINGTSNITCLDGGSWSDEVPTCQAVDCGPPPEISNSTVVFMSSTSYRGTAIYDCDDDLVIVGDPTVYCDASGNWTSTESFICVDAEETTQPILTTTIEDITTIVVTSEFPLTTSPTAPATTIQPVITEATPTTFITTELVDATISSSESTPVAASTGIETTTRFSSTLSTDSVPTETETAASSTIFTTVVTYTGLSTDTDTAVPITTLDTNTPTESIDTTAPIVTTSTTTQTAPFTTLPETTPEQRTTDSATTLTILSSTETPTTIPEAPITSGVPSTPAVTMVTTADTPSSSVNPNTDAPNTSASITPRSSTMMQSTQGGGEPTTQGGGEPTTPGGGEPTATIDATTSIGDHATPTFSGGTTSHSLTTTTVAKTTTTATTGHASTTFQVTDSTTAQELPTTRTVTTQEPTTIPMGNGPTDVSIPVGKGSTDHVKTGPGSTSSDRPTTPTAHDSSTPSGDQSSTSLQSSTQSGGNSGDPFPVVLVASLSVVCGSLLLLLLIIVICVCCCTPDKQSNAKGLPMTDFAMPPSAGEPNSFEHAIENLYSDMDYTQSILAYKTPMPRISTSTVRPVSADGPGDDATEGPDDVFFSDEAVGDSEDALRYPRDEDLRVVPFPTTFEERMADQVMNSFGTRPTLVIDF